jgi:hypothetical protein
MDFTAVGVTIGVDEGDVDQAAQFGVTDGE